MKKLVKLLLTLIVALTLVSCAGGADKAKTGGLDPKDYKVEAEIGENDLYLITDVGTIDDKSFNQGAWEGLVAFAEGNGVKAHYIQPKEKSDAAYESAIDEAVNEGAKIIVTPGFLFMPAITTAAPKYPDVQFILVDGVVEGDNVKSIIYSEEQSGFLAGYAAVKEGYTKLGFMGGMAVPAVKKFGYGFLAGADYAAGEMGVKVEAKYTYLGEFGPKPEFQTMASSWYNDGIEVIHAAAGGAGNSVMAAATQAEKWMIGVDVDQKDENERVLTSAMKNLAKSVADASKEIFTTENYKGSVQLLGVLENGVQISNDFSRFQKFTKEDYDAIYKKLVDDTDGIRSNIPTDQTAENVKDLKFENVTVESIGN